ncbi:hypothetical protein [Chryseobacterium cucumeris]|uniref:hypothetical protein n=2 Tax=Chryseobacterium cucumeris TaxID=1813611 RepID=UPI001041C5AD|nr:hypothetical protein [Chryseobacterium cucumeris]
MRAIAGGREGIRRFYLCMETNFNLDFYRTILTIFLFTVGIYSCTSVSKKTTIESNKIKILSIDSTSDYYVFTVRDDIILAEKNKVTSCNFFKNIIKDSIIETSKIKSGTKYVIIGFNELTINNIKIKKKGELVKAVNSCGAFIP